MRELQAAGCGGRETPGARGHGGRRGREGRWDARDAKPLPHAALHHGIGEDGDYGHGKGKGAADGEACIGA